MVEISDKEYQLIHARLRAAEEASRMVTVVHDSNDAIIIQDFEGKILAWNCGAEQIYGYSEQEALKMTIWQLAPPDKAAEQKDFNRRIFAGEAVTSFETQRLTKDGRRIDVWLTVTKLVDEAGKVIGIASTERDVTERNRLEKTRQEMAATKISEDAAREYAESIINTVREPLIALDQDLRVVTASHSFYEVFKVNPSETMGQLIYDLGNKQWDIPKLRELLETILPQKTSFDNYEVEHDFTAIGKRTMLLNARQIQRASGKERVILLAIEDITEKKKLETETLKARNAAEAATRAKSEFLANMSHEFRTPLNSIIGFSEVLEDQLFGPLNERQKQYLHNVISSSHHLLGLINDILDLSKIEAGKMEFDPGKIDLKKTLQNVLDMQGEKALRHSIKLALEIAPEAAITIMADERKLKQIIYNLLSNALKFTPDGGSVKVAARRTAKDVEISIADTGIGIKADDLPRLFTEFTQLDSGYTKTKEGTGLGLALTKTLVEMHGGRIWIDSGGEGKGTTFSFTLPIKEG